MAISSHESANAVTTTWLTPIEIIQSLGSFDLDPCCPLEMPWKTARTMYHHPKKDGLKLSWFGRVWLNPPYGREINDWMKRMAEHRNGIALIFARTETDCFHRFIWPVAHSFLFLRGRLHFYRADGIRAKANAGAPSVLISYTLADTEWLKLSGIAGKLVMNNGER